MKMIDRVIRVEKAVSNIDRSISIIDSITHSVFNNEFDYGTEIMLSNDMKIKLRQADANINCELSYYDKAVYDAICGLLYNGVYSFTSMYVYRMIMGNNKADGSINLSGIDESINKLSNIIITLMNKDNERQKYNLILDQRLLSIAQCRVIVKNGQEVEGWMLTEEPALYKYAKGINKIECFKLELLKTSLAFTENNVKVIKYLFDRVLMLKNNKRNNNIIKFAELYQVIGFDKRDRSSKTYIKRKRILNKCEKIFDFWKNETGILGKWCCALKGNEKVGYKLKIELNGFKVLVIDDWGDGEVDEVYEDVVFEVEDKPARATGKISENKEFGNLLSFCCDNDIDYWWFKELVR